MKTRLSTPTSPRMWVKTEEGKWYQTPWTEEGVRECKSAGGWFRPGGHSFVNDTVASLAYSGEGVSKIKAPRVAAPMFAPVPPPTAEELLAELGLIEADPRQLDLVEELFKE